MKGSLVRKGIIWIALFWIASVPLFALWNYTVANIRPDLTLRFGRALVGATISPQITRPLWEAFELGTLQKAISDFASRAVAYRPLLVRINNEVIFSFLHGDVQSAALRGDGDELIEQNYLDEYCGRSLPSFLPMAQIWAHKLREIQDYYSDRRATVPLCDHTIKNSI